MKNVLVIGVGQFGINVIKKLYELKCEVMAIDIDEEALKKTLPYVISAQIGDSTNAEYVETIGVRDFDLVYVCIGDFKASLETTLLIKELGAKFVVSLASNEVHEKFLRRNGADQTVFPQKLIGEWGAIRFGLNNIIDFIQIDDNTGIYEVNVPASWIGKTVIDLNIRKKYDVNVIGYKKGNNTLQSITPAIPFDKDMSIMVIGTSVNIQKCFKL